MSEQLTVAVGRRAARAILIDELGRLALVKRAKPAQQPYWTAPGGGVEDGDGSIEAALHRELSEELGAEAVVASQVFLVSSPSDAGVAVQHFFVARLTKFDASARSGPELSDPSRGGYELDRIDLRGDKLASIDLKPTALKEFILANREALLAEAATAGHRHSCRPRESRSYPGQFGTAVSRDCASHDEGWHVLAGHLVCVPAALGEVTDCGPVAVGQGGRELVRGLLGWFDVVLPQGVAHDVEFGASVDTREVAQRFPGHRGEDPFVDRTADDPGFAQGVVDVPEHQERVWSSVAITSSVRRAMMP